MSVGSVRVHSKHQRELAIDDKQRDAIVAEVQKTQVQLVPLQGQMPAQADKIITIEREFKRPTLGCGSGCGIC